MNTQLTSLLQIVISYIVVLLIAYLGINFLSTGFLNKFIVVKISRGRKTLVEVHDVGGVYYRTGIISDGFLSYKNKKKEKKTLEVTNADIQYRMGLKTIATDGVKNTIIRQDGSQVEGHDAVKTDNLMVRCLTSPQLQDKVLKIILILLVVAVLLILVDTVTVIQIKKAITPMSSQLNVLLNSTRTI
jgi:hypothetical protein